MPASSNPIATGLSLSMVVTAGKPTGVVALAGAPSSPAAASWPGRQ
ncbi:hypothetical protein [Caulobacter sp. FWC2]|nr:hypothetical protein [Caulobacter sp. FWC2]